MVGGVAPEDEFGVQPCAAFQAKEIVRIQGQRAIHQDHPLQVVRLGRRLQRRCQRHQEQVTLVQVVGMLALGVPDFPVHRCLPPVLVDHLSDGGHRTWTIRHIDLLSPNRLRLGDVIQNR